MSLKVEQRIENYQFTEFTPRIYTTGAYLVPMKVMVNNEERWIWVVDEFQDETYNSDGESVSPFVYGKSISEILNLEDEE